MKKNYAYTFESNQPKWRQLCLAFCSLCLFITQFVPNIAQAANTHDENLSKVEDLANSTKAEDQFAVRIDYGGYAKQLDCDRNPVTLNAYVTLNGEEIKEGITYSWTGPDSYYPPQQAVRVNEPGEHTLVATHVATGATATATLTVTRMPDPVGSAGPDKVLTRENPTVTIEGSVADDFYEVMWFAIDGGNIVSGRYTLNPVVDAPGTYHMVITDRLSKCRTVDEVVVTKAEDALVARIGNGGVLQIDCYGTPIKVYPYVTLNGDEVKEGLTYSWSGPNDYKSEERVATFSEPGDYTLVVTHTATGLTSTATHAISQIPKPEGSAGPDKVLTRDNPTVTLEGSVINNSGTPIWLASDGGNFVSGYRTLNPVVDAPGTYTLILRNGRGCTSEYTVKVTREDEENTFTASIGFTNVPVLDCAGSNSVTMIAFTKFTGYTYEGNFTYKWSGPNGFTAEGKYATVTEPGDYTLVVTETIGNLTASSSHTISPPMYPTGSAGPDKKLTCQNSTVTLEGSGSNDAVIWLASHGGNIVSGERTFTPVVNAPGIYTMIITNSKSGCKVEDVVKVTREEELTVNATGGQLDCSTGTVQLRASSSAEGATYSWTGPNGFTSTAQNPVVKVAGTYTLTVADTAGSCSASTSAVVTPASTEVEITQHVIDFNSKPRGLISSIDTEAGPVALMGRKRNADGNYAPENYAAIFDTQDPTGDDVNLYTVDWGNALIINQYQNNVPDANRWGGELILDFSAIGPVTMESMKVVGMDNYEQMSWVYLYDGDGKELNKVYLRPLGINSMQTVSLGNTRGVMKMKVVLDGRNSMQEYSGSAAIDDIKFHRETTTSSPCQNVAENITHALAYPTAFSDQAKVEFIVRETENYSLSLYDTQGMLIARLKEGTARAGEMTTVEVSGRNLKEGMYLARLMTDSGAKTFRLILKR
jgi:hypothetical protein